MNIWNHAKHIAILPWQHRFVWQQNESISDNALQVKKLAKHCQLNCDCGKQVSKMLLRMLFARDLLDTKIRGQILQNKNLQNRTNKVVNSELSLEDLKEI